MKWNFGFSSVRAWVDCLRAVWLPGCFWPRRVSGRSRQPIRKSITSMPFRPQLTPVEERLSAGVDISMGGILAAAMGGAAGFLTQALVRDLVGGPSQTGSENISLTGARGDIASAAPPPDDAKDAKVAEVMAESIQVSYASTGSPEGHEQLPGHRQAIDQYFASLAGPQASSDDNSLTTPLDEPSAKTPQGNGGHKIDDGSGNGGGGHGGSEAPAVDAEGSADPLRGATNSSSSSNYLTNSALATSMAGTGNGAASPTGNTTAMAFAGSAGASSPTLAAESTTPTSTLPRTPSRTRSSLAPCPARTTRPRSSRRKTTASTPCFKPGRPPSS